MEGQSLSRLQASGIINQLKSGTTPLEAAAHIDVGRGRWYQGMDYYFYGAAEGGESKVRFISGRYGDGKTHLMAMARYKALQQNFAVSYASAEHVRLDRFHEVYLRIAKQITTTETEGGLEFILKRWQKQVIGQISHEVERLRKEPALDINFRIAVQSFLETSDPDQQQRIAQWLLGEPIRLPELGINRHLRPGDSRDMMRSLSVFLRFLGYSGLLVLLDELDRIQYQTQRQRDGCYQVLRELMDNADGQGGMQGALFYCAAPEEMFTSQRGFMEYEALRSRLEPASMASQGTGGQRRVDYRGTVINLQDTPLSREDHCEMAKRIRAVHATALNWNPVEKVPDSQLEEIVDRVMASSYNISAPRLVATTVATVVDLAEQGAEYNVNQEIEQAYDRAEKARIEKHHKKFED
jgi:hypothetical protein